MLIRRSLLLVTLGVAVACDKTPTSPSSDVARVPSGFRTLVAGPGTFVDIGNLGQANLSIQKINSNGWVVGMGFTTDSRQRAFIWKPTTGIAAIPSGSGPVIASAFDINDNGEVSGSIGGLGNGAVVWSEANGLRILGGLDGIRSSIAWGINSKGEATGSGTVIGTIESRAMMWTADGTAKLVGILAGDTQANGFGINDDEVVVGTSQKNNIGRAFIWTEAAGIRLLPLPRADIAVSEANAINNSGQVTGRNGTFAYVWSEAGGTTILPKLAGASLCRGNDINDAGHVAGSCDGGSNPRAFIWTPEDGIIEIGPSRALGINDKDQLVGSTGFAPNITAWVWTPPVSNHPPVANAGAGYSGPEGSAITFDASASADEDGDNLTYTWTFGDGTFGSGAQVSHLYPDDGTYAVTLEVSDGKATSTATTSAVVTNVAPSIGAVAGGTILVGDNYSSGGSFDDPGPDTWSGSVDYGDGSGDNAISLSGKSFSLSHTYTVAGVFTVVVSIGDGDVISHQSTTVTVQSPAQAITSQVEDITGLLSSGAIAENVAGGLTQRLVDAANAATPAEAAVAANQVNAFINSVRAMERSGRLSHQTAAEIIAAANNILVALSRV